MVLSHIFNFSFNGSPNIFFLVSNGSREFQGFGKMVKITKYVTIFAVNGHFS